MTVSDALTTAAIDRLDAELLLAHVLGTTRTAVMTAHHTILTEDQIIRWNDLLTRRRAGEPVAYITGIKEFYGRPFAVSPSTLIPRPSTEILVESAYALITDRKEGIVEADTGISVITQILSPSPIGGGGRGWRKTALIADIGCGSGCIGITLGLMLPKRKLLMIDLSSQAVDVAKGNAIALGLKNPVRWMVGDGSEAIAQITEPFILVSNPPYIPNIETLMRDVQDFEPHTALFAGEDGMDMIRPMLEAARKNKRCLGVAVECRSDQTHAINQILRN